MRFTNCISVGCRRLRTLILQMLKRLLSLLLLPLSALVVSAEIVHLNDGSTLHGNIRGMDVLPQIGANVNDILRRDTLVLTKDAAEQLQERLK